MRWQAGRAPSAPAGTRDGSAVGDPDRCFRRTVPAEAAQLVVLRRDLGAWMAARGVDPTTDRDALIAVGEVAANAIEHAYPEGVRGTVEIEVADGGDGGLTVTVRDHGRWRGEPLAGGERGRGLAMVRAVATDVRCDRAPDGTTVRFRVGAHPGQAGEPSDPRTWHRGHQ